MDSEAISWFQTVAVISGPTLPFAGTGITQAVSRENTAARKSPAEALIATRTVDVGLTAAPRWGIDTRLRCGDPMKRRLNARSSADLPVLFRPTTKLKPGSSRIGPLSLKPW